MEKIYSIYWTTQEGLTIKLLTDTMDACEELLAELLQLLPFPEEITTDDLCILKDEYALYEVEGSFPVDCINTGSLEYCKQLQQMYIVSKKYSEDELAIIEEVK